jgi:glyoxylase I family protein
MSTAAHSDSAHSDSASGTAPSVTGLHHLSLTVTDLEASVEWYSRVLGWQRQPGTIPHFEAEDTGYCILVADANSGLIIALHTNTGNAGEAFAEAHTGLDHASFHVASRTDLDAWAAWFDENQVEHTGVRDVAGPPAMSTLVFRDLDNIQLELIAMG